MKEPSFFKHLVQWVYIWFIRLLLQNTSLAFAFLFMLLWQYLTGFFEYFLSSLLMQMPRSIVSYYFKRIRFLGLICLLFLLLLILFLRHSWQVLCSLNYLCFVIFCDLTTTDLLIQDVIFVRSISEFFEMVINFWIDSNWARQRFHLFDLFLNFFLDDLFKLVGLVNYLFKLINFGIPVSLLLFSLLFLFLTKVVHILRLINRKLLAQFRFLITF